MRALKTAAILVTLAAALNAAVAAAAQPSNRSIAQDMNATAAYLQTANESAYLVFYPNLTTAYALLNEARNFSQSRPLYAAGLLARSRQSADAQVGTIEGYARGATATVLVLIGVTVGALLFAMKRRPRGRRVKQS